MRYETLEEAGQLKIEYNGGFIDAYSLGVLQINMQDIIDKTAFWLLSEEGLLEPTWRRPRYLPQRFLTPHSRLIRAEVSNIGTGSLIETLSFGVAFILANSDTRAVLQNLAASVVWAIGASQLKWLVSKPEKPPIEIPPPLRRKKDPLDVVPNLMEIGLAIAENSNGKTVELRIMHEKIGRQEKTEVVLKIGGQNE